MAEFQRVRLVLRRNFEMKNCFVFLFAILISFVGMLANHAFAEDLSQPSNKKVQFSDEGIENFVKLGLKHNPNMRCFTQLSSGGCDIDNHRTLQVF